jgi:serine/threonine protein phosphatase PrpC/predicted Ser/Thr protein kinase
MSHDLKISIGQHSDKGAKEINQDFHGALVPEQPALGMKGVAIAIADGISSSNVSQVASESAIKSFMMDYYCTSDSWTVKTAVQRVIAATNSWLHAQTRRSEHAYDKDRGYVCTLSTMVLKSRTAHIFHIGDSRIYRVAGASLEQLTTDHRVAVSAEQSYLSRALGMEPQLDIDSLTEPLEIDDVFILATDGVYEHASAAFIVNTLTDHGDNLDEAAKLIVKEAYENDSPDNLTVQIVRIDDLPDGEATDYMGQATELPPPPLLEARMEFDGYTIIRQVHASSRSHIYLASDNDNEALVILKIPSIDLRDDPAYLKRFMMEKWIARRLNSAHVLKTYSQTRKRNFLYVVTEFIDGQTLTQWMIDHPQPDLEDVRGIIEQTARGLRAFHRMEMVHQDLRPENIMIDKSGTVKIIDFGSTKVAGVLEAEPAMDGEDILGTVQYTAPEYFVGDISTWRSDAFSLGIITYQMLTGKLPYGAQIAKTRTKAQQRKLRYTSAPILNPQTPEWLDGAIHKSVHPDPYKRYDALSEFIYDLRHPNKDFTQNGHVPLAERNPVLFWKSLCVILLGGIVAQLAYFTM